MLRPFIVKVSVLGYFPYYYSSIYSSIYLYTELSTILKKCRIDTITITHFFLIIDTTTITLTKIIVDTITNTKLS